MFKVFATNLVVSKGYEDNPALKFFGEEDSCVQFRVGEKVYDKNAENNTRWVYHTVKAFGSVCERIKAMKLKESSYINFTGKETEEIWEDPKTKEKKSARVIVLDDIEYASGGGKKSEGDNQTQGSSQKKTDASAKSDKGASSEQSENFEGYEPFGGGSFF